MFSLTMAEKLGEYIAGTAIEALETEKLIQEYKSEVVKNVYGQAQSIEEVMDNVHSKLWERDLKINTIHVDNVYNQSAVAQINADKWKTSQTIAEARQIVSSVSNLQLSFFKKVVAVKLTG